jgi:DUF2075 family protein
MPRNAKADARRLRSGIPKSDFWASDPADIEQVGGFHTAQGFEFDYVGVIVGPDFFYRSADGRRVGQPEQSHHHIVRCGVSSAVQIG